MNGWWKFHRKMDQHAVWSLPALQFKVWIAILNLANHEPRDWWNGSERVLIPKGSFITSQDNLAIYSKTSRKTVRLCIANLIRLGSIRAKIRANRYTQIDLINSDRWRGSEVEEGQVPGQLGANSGPTEGQLRATTGEGKKEESIKKEKKRRIKTLLANPEGFASFWLRYPRKVGKAAAEKAWNHLNPQNGLVETIIDSIESHKTQWGDVQYIPYPATFLNGRRWEDVLGEPTTPRHTPIDLKAHWKSQERYLVALKAHAVVPSYRVPEWEQPTS